MGEWVPETTSSLPGGDGVGLGTQDPSGPADGDFVLKL